MVQERSGETASFYWTDGVGSVDMTTPLAVHIYPIRGESALAQTLVTPTFRHNGIAVLQMVTDEPFNASSRKHKLDASWSGQQFTPAVR
jgi:hypothetical protein